MKLYKKYTQLQDRKFLVNLMTDTVYSTMQLENQPVPKNKVEEIVLSVLKEQALKGLQFLKD